MKENIVLDMGFYESKFKMRVPLLFILALLSGVENCCYFDTPSGPVEGFLNYVHEDPVKIFLGIPFAEPPVGDRRFKKPEPVKPWTQTLNATIMPPGCMQYTEYPYPWADDLEGKSEDCLYLNIFAPPDAVNGSNLAVLFWIFGGGFYFGSNRLDNYDASALAIHGNVIVVTINYRLGLFGFLTSDTEDAPGNAGMYDIVMALQWVNGNIESFGGDKKRITLFGESAGAIAISLMCISPLTKDMFSKAIIQSGSFILVKPDQKQANLALTRRIAETVGCASENDTSFMIGCLKSKNATHLTRVLWSFNPKASMTFFPQYGDELLPRNFSDIIREGNICDVPILIGNVRDEGSLMITTKQPEIFGFFGHKNPIINKTQAENMILGIFSGFDNPSKFVQHYLGSIPDDDYDSIKRQVYTSVGDKVILCETVYFAEMCADRKNDVYYYLFSHRRKNSIWYPWMGAAHTEEIQFVFGRPLRKPHLYEPAEVELSQKVIEVWTNFAKHGIPSESFDWPKYSRENPVFVQIDTDFKGDNYRTGPHLENCNLMRQHFGF